MPNTCLSWGVFFKISSKFYIFSHLRIIHRDQGIIGTNLGNLWFEKGPPWSKCFNHLSGMKFRNIIFIFSFLMLFYMMLRQKRQNVTCNATIVTAYYKMRSKHSHEEYVSWMSNMLTFRDCMVIFTEENLVGWCNRYREASKIRLMFRKIRDLRPAGYPTVIRTVGINEDRNWLSVARSYCLCLLCLGSLTWW